MSRTVGPKGTTMRATVDPRRRTARVPPAPTPNDRRATADLDARLQAWRATHLEGWRAESFGLLADDEGQAIGKQVYTSAERHNARRRRERAAEALASTPEGRAAMHEAAAILAAPSTRSVARMFARAGVDFRPSLTDGFRIATDAMAEHDVTSRTGAAFAVGYGVLFAVGLHLEGEAAEAGTHFMAMGKATSENGVKVTAAVSGFRDLQQLALACFSKAAVMFEMMTRSQADARAVEGRRQREREDIEYQEQCEREAAEQRARAAALPQPGQREEHLEPEPSAGVDAALQPDVHSSNAMDSEPAPDDPTWIPRALRPWRSEVEDMAAIAHDARALRTALVARGDVLAGTRRDGSGAAFKRAVAQWIESESTP